MIKKTIRISDEINIENKFFYVINYPNVEKELCQLEMRQIFNINPKGKYVFSNININPSRSPFIKHKISIIYRENSLSKIIENIVSNRVSYENFKVLYIKSENGDVDYSERLQCVKHVGLVITGQSQMHNPDVILAISKVDDEWIFGGYEKNDYKWHERETKPYSYSNSLSLKVAKALVNICVQNNLQCTLVDPCCGIGTVVIEALDLGINVTGYEISEAITENGNKNIEFFGYSNKIINKDMHTINKRYDVSIVDIPYGIFSPVTLEDQKKIIKTVRRISDRLVIVTMDNMNEHIIDSGFTILDQCTIRKNNITRYITVCI